MNTTYVLANALNGTTVLAIKENNPTARIICLEVFPFYVEHLKNELKVEVALLDTSKDLVLQLENIGTQMKIDWNNVTVLMNAPYQEVDSDSGERKDEASNLWGDFIYAFAELAPRIGSVQPSSWLSPSADYNGKRYARFADEWRAHFRKINIKECSRHFPGVGSHFTYFILDKLNKYNKTELVTEDGKLYFPFIDNPVLGYNNLTLNGINNISSVVHGHWANDFGFSRQGYNILNEKDNVYSSTGAFPFFHTKAQKNKKPGKSVMSKVVSIDTHAGVKAAFTYSDIPHKHQHTPKVLISLSGEYDPILDEVGELGYTSMVIPIICNSPAEAKQVHYALTKPEVVLAMSCLKWNGFVNIETLMRLKCHDDILRQARKNSIHAQTRGNKIGKRHTLLNKNVMKGFTSMTLDEEIKKAILTEEAEHNLLSQAQENVTRRLKDRTDKTGEVFSSSELVIEMLESLPNASWNETEQHVDPAMGNSQFLAASCIARAEMKQANWLERTFGVDLMIDNLNESKDRLVKIAVRYGYDKQVARDIVNENLHLGNTLDPEAVLEDQTELDRKFMIENFSKNKISKKKPNTINVKKMNEQQFQQLGAEL